MKITKKFLKSLNPCEDGFEYWLECKEPDLSKFMLKCHADNHSEWTNWLFVRSVDKSTRVKYAIFSAELVLHIFEKKYPKDDRPRKAIQAAKDYLDGKFYGAYAAAAAAAASYAEKDIQLKIIKYGISLLEGKND